MKLPLWAGRFALYPLDRSVSQKMELALGEPAGHGPYLPALSRLTALCRNAQPYLAPFAETKVLFMTDGKPSDQVDARVLPGELAAALRDSIED